MACNQFIVLAVARERCRYGIFASVDLVIARVLRRHAVGQIRCFNRVCLPVVGHGFVRKDNRAHIVNGFLDSQRCCQFGQVGIIAVRASERCRDRVRIGIDFAIVRIGNRHAVGKFARDVD